MKTEEIKNAAIFRGMNEEELSAALRELHAADKSYKKRFRHPPRGRYDG